MSSQLWTNRFGSKDHSLDGPFRLAIQCFTGPKYYALHKQSHDAIDYVGGFPAKKIASEASPKSGYAVSPSSPRQRVDDNLRLIKLNVVRLSGITISSLLYASVGRQTANAR